MDRHEVGFPNCALNSSKLQPTLRKGPSALDEKRMFVVQISNSCSPLSEKTAELAPFLVNPSPGKKYASEYLLLLNPIDVK
jgi:hypothetical protein